MDSEASEHVAKKARIEPIGAFPPVCEADVGIQVYATAGTPGFHGIIKERYTDFMVNEITEDGTVVRLTSLVPPVVAAVPVDREQARQALALVVGEEAIGALKRLDAAAASERPEPVQLSNISDKAARTQVHTSIRALFPNLVSDTQGDTVRVVLKGGKGGGRRDNAPRGEWPGGALQYCQAVLHKSNLDTTECLSRIASLLHVSTSCITTAGTKDKRGVTVQRARFFKVPADRLATLNKTLRGMALGNFEYVGTPLRLGMLSGNRFVVVLRDVQATEEQVDEAMRALQQRGFVNYFGMQRFGTGSVRTYLVGSAILRNDFREAAHLIMTPRVGEGDSTPACMAFAEGQSADAVLALLPRRCVVERLLLQNLKRVGRQNYTDAIGTLPRPMRLLYGHSFQSYIWNRMVSLRLSRHGFVAAPGDLVLAGEEEVARVPEVSEGDDEAELVSDEGGPDVPAERAKVLELTAETAAQYTIFDVVLPLPGVDVRYPPHMQDDYLSAMAEHGVTQEMLRTRRKEYVLHGAYRRVVSAVKDLAWEQLLYDDKTAQLTVSDLERVRDTVPTMPQGGRYRALRLEFSLKSSQYATMVLREVLKIDTSSAFQASLTAANKEAAAEPSASAGPSAQLSDDV